MNMIFVADIGNTSITVGVYCAGKLKFTTKLPTKRQGSAAEYEKRLGEFFELSGILSSDMLSSVISSVVPEVMEEFIRAVENITGTQPYIVGERYNGNLKIEILPIGSLGADLIADSVGAIRKYPLPCLIADLGTATKILVIDKNGVFRGCTISPGVKISLDALNEHTSLLPSVSLIKPKKAIGENTVECMQSGIVFGTAAMLDGLIKRMKAELECDEVTVVATGGYSKEIISCCETEIIFDENLLLDGLKAICDEAEKH